MVNSYETNSECFYIKKQTEDGGRRNVLARYYVNFIKEDCGKCLYKITPDLRRIERRTVNLGGPIFEPNVIGRAELAIHPRLGRAQ